MDDSNNRFFLIPKYENYAFDPKRMVVINLKNKKTLKPLKCTGVISFKLFKNGMPVTVTLFEIFKGVIEKYFNPKKI